MVNSENNRLGPTGYLGIWLGKILTSATRLAGRGGTTLPGRVALKLTPRLLPALSQQIETNIVITGTNGKSTTTALLNHILQSAGYPTVSNNTGANLSWGIATTLINASSWGGKLHNSYGVLEVDEGVLPKLTGQLKPAAVVVTNIFPDQSDRFGGVDYVRQNIEQGLASLPPSVLLIINGDDPLLASLDLPQKEVWYYGFGNYPVDQPAVNQPLPEGYICPRCKHLLHYGKIFLAHQGHYSCLNCGLKRPRPAVTLLDYIPTGEETGTLKLDLQGWQEEINCPLPGTYNVYNVLASITAALALGFSVDSIKQALTGFTRVSGRLQKITLGDEGKSLVIVLIKNAIGADQALQLLNRQGENPFPSSDRMEQRSSPGRPAPAAPGDENKKEGIFSLLIAINDHLADGIDVSWLWNAGFEQLATLREQPGQVTVSGTRAWDVAVRLKYAGLDFQRITVEKNPNKALKNILQATPPGGTLYVLANYSALASISRVLRRLESNNPGGEHNVRT